VGCVDDPEPPEPPAGSACPKPLAAGAYVYIRNVSPYGHGFHSTPYVHGDPEMCRLIHGVAVEDCHFDGLGNKRAACEIELLHGCPIWQYRTAGNAAPRRCLQPDHPEVSCDHWGTPGGAQDDPKTPAYEGLPTECGAQRVDGLPAAGFYTVAHGLGDIRACRPDGGGCGPWRAFER
jgi:hypothetical protein